MTDLSHIKEYILWDTDKEVAYISNDLSKLENIDDGWMTLCCVIDTKYGLKVCFLHQYDTGEYRIARSIVHRDSFIRFCKEVKYL